MKRKKYYIFITLLITAIVAVTCIQCSMAPTAPANTGNVGVTQSTETTAAATTASGTTGATAAATTATTTGGQANKIHVINSSVIGTNGTISPLGDQSVNEGSDITFTMTPDAGYHVGSVVIDGNRTKEYKLDPNTSKATYTFSKVSDGHTIIVQFIQNKT